MAVSRRSPAARTASESLSECPTCARGREEITGDLSGTERLLAGLDLREAP